VEITVIYLAPDIIPQRKIAGGGFQVSFFAVLKECITFVLQIQFIC
jgi:glutamate-1-semialdehyde aminotransferase